MLTFAIFRKITAILLVFAGVLLSQLCAEDVNVMEFGAIASGETNTTLQLQEAIDRCHDTGGGQVIVPAGKYLTGSLFLKSNVDLHLKQNAIILASTNNPEDFSGAVIILKSVENVTISGNGMINGQGWHANFNNRGREIKVARPEMILVEDSKHIRITGIKLRDQPRWGIRLKRSEWITIDNINIYSHVNTNNDGIDIDSSNVVITNSIIDCEDDAICFKSWNKGYVVENVTISNCRIASSCNVIKFGTWSAVGFRNITITNCVITAPDKDHVARPWYERLNGITHQPTGISGLALEVVDGGFMDQVTISNITMRGIQTPIFIRLGNRDGIGSLRNVIISNIIAENESWITSSITGIKDAFVENVMIRDVIFNSKGTATEEHTNKNVIENDEGYPENRMYGDHLPAHGFYVRHARGIHFENMKLLLRNPDSRPAILFDNVYDSSLKNIQADLPEGDMPLFRMVGCSNIRFSDFRYIEPIETLLSVEGEESRRIVIENCDLFEVENPFVAFDGANPSEVKLVNNFK
ncbi:MAG: glycosyl hydrolase family 28 protein [Opitutales bacterium]|nr:glycosyl hydrolase family 28 protein [Opitutales bacterium]